MVEALGQSLLTERGLTGSLIKVSDTWQYRGERGSQGVAVEIEGEPDEATLTQAADMIAEALK